MKKKDLSKMNDLQKVNWLIEFFDNKESSQIIPNLLCDNKGNHCAEGWLYEELGFGDWDYLFNFSQYGIIKGFALIISGVNNGRYSDLYKGDTPKERVLNFLKDLRVKILDLSETTEKEILENMSVGAKELINQ